MIGIAEPFGLAGLAAAAALVALHLLERRRRTIAVSTVRLWKQLPARTLAPRRLRPDLLLALQIAAALALTGALAKPYLEGPPVPAGPAALAVVIDVSASMGAREAAGTRLDLARRRVRALVDALPPGADAMLVTAGARPAVALRWTADRATMLGRLETLEPLDVAASLGPAVDLAVASADAHGIARIAVVTDLPRDESGVPADLLERLDYVQVGRTDANRALTSVRVDTAPFGARNRAVLVAETRNFAGAASRVTLAARVGDRLWARRALDLPARGSAIVSLTDPPEAGLVTLALEGGDALAADDHAVAWVPAPAPLDLAVVSDDESFARTLGSLARAVPGTRVEVIAPAAYRGTTPRMASTLVLDGIVPEGTLDRPALVVDPPVGNAVCPAGRFVDDAAVVDWDGEHPALAGLAGLQALDLVQARRLDVPPWGSATVLAAAAGAAFPLLVTGERDGRRLACLGVRPVLASADDVPLLLLVLGTLRWLGEPADAAPLAVATGEAIPAADGEIVVPDRVGARTIATARGARLVLANLLDARESDIGRASEGEWPATADAPQSVARAARTDAAWWLALVAALVLGVEWTAWARR